MTYLHPADPVITAFAQEIEQNCTTLAEICRSLLLWFDRHIAYSRLSAPFFPLQRSDLDVLSMKSGTCGDYANLTVSVLTYLGYEAGYAYVHRDCYGDAQDHICAAVREGEKQILIDPTQPYRKWHGFDCPHREFELLTPVQFEEKMKAEEQRWILAAKRCGGEKLAGLFYAPWIHEQCVFEAADLRESVFFLLMIDRNLNPDLYVYLQRYTAQKGHMPVMAQVTKEKTVYRLSCNVYDDLWDEAQWGEPMDLPQALQSSESEKAAVLVDQILKLLPQINQILKDAGCHELSV